MSATKPGRATEDLLDSLHGLLTQSMLDDLNRYRAPDKDGVIGTVPPAFLGQVIKFLQANGIDSPARAKKINDALAGVMPDFDLHEDTPMQGHA